MSTRSDRRQWGRRILAKSAAALLGMLLVFGKTDVHGAEYSYTVTFYPGNHGSFLGTEAVTVDNSVSGSDYQITADGSAIRVSGLSAGDVVGLDAAMEGAVELEEGSRYYVKGIRVSGRDNSTVDTSAFRVEEDRDYVVAYGISGDLTSYVVNYQDAQGNTLASSRTYYGNVGDKPRIAYRYIEGYQPQAYNLTKTLSKNAAENVFTFTYSPIPAGQTGGGTEAPGGNTAPAVPAGNTPGQTGTVPNPEGGEAQTPPEGQGGEAPNPEEGQGAEAPNPEEGQEGDAQNPEGEENGPQEEVDLDDPDTPLGNYNGENPGDEESAGFHFPMWASIVIAVSGAAAVAAAICVTLMAGKKAKNRKEKHEKK